MNELNKSLKRFKNKKEECLKFISAAEALTKNYEKNFPPAAGTGEERQTQRSEIFKDLGSKLNDSRLKILVAGQFKHGKSTLVNALLGEEILPAYSTPCTAVITEIEYGEQKKAIISFKKKLAVIPKGLEPKVLAHIGDRTENIPDMNLASDNLGEELEKYLAIPENEDDKEQKESVAESPYACCKLFWPLELCKNDAMIIDSPGLNEATARDETTYTYVPQADMILHVLNAQQLFGKPDKEFIQKLKIFGNPPLMFVVNRFDQLNTAKDQERVKQRALRDLPQYSPYGESGIFFTSAYKALNGRIDNDSNLYNESGFAGFEQTMAKIIEEERGKIKLESNMQAACREIGNFIENYIPNLTKQLAKNVNELEKKFAEQQKHFAALEETKNQIQKKINSGFLAVQKVIFSDVKNFIIDFADKDMASYIFGAEIDLGIFATKESQKKANLELSESMFEGLKKEFEDFSPVLQDGLANQLEELKDDIQDKLKDFEKILASIQNSLDIEIKGSPFSVSPESDIDEAGDLFNKLLGGIAVGGGVGAGAMLLVEIIGGRLIAAAWGGPIGWAIGIFAAIVSIIIAIANKDDVNVKYKEIFIQEAGKKIRAEADNVASNIAEEIAKTLNQQKDLLLAELEKEIANTRNPILEAIAIQKRDYDKLDLKKKELQNFQQQYAELLDKGNRILNSL